jgi:hypothetical protein
MKRSLSDPNRGLFIMLNSNFELSSHVYIGACMINGELISTKSTNTWSDMVGEEIEVLC